MPEASASGEVFHGEAEVRVPWTRVAEALLWNPGRALGLGVLFGSGEEMIDAKVTTDDGVVVAERERLTFAIPRPSTFDPLIGRTTTARISTRLDTGLTQISAESDIGGVSVRAVVGITPHGEYRTTVRWRGEVTGGPGSAASLAWTRLAGLPRRLVRQDVATFEATADQLDVTVDHAVEQLRLLRSGS